ncbi:hypothetical protein D3C87_176410 [compost metagenome]
MQRIHPETELEKKLMSMGAMYIEENQILDALYEIIGSDLVEGQELEGDVKVQVMDEISDYFFRLDMNFGSEVRGDCIGILEEMWAVFDKDSALKNLENIRTQGHRTKFNVLKDCVPADGSIDAVSLEKFKQIFLFDFSEGQEIQLKDEDYRKLAQWIQRTQKYVSDSGILAWDVARYIQLVRLCFVAGYFDDNEAWAQILKIAPVAEGKFSSWTEFAQSFLIGRTFWAGSESPEAKAICERLLGHPASPWQFFSWD